MWYNQIALCSTCLSGVRTEPSNENASSYGCAKTLDATIGGPPIYLYYHRVRLARKCAASSSNRRDVVCIHIHYRLVAVKKDDGNWTTTSQPLTGSSPVVIVLEAKSKALAVKSWTNSDCTPRVEFGSSPVVIVLLNKSKIQPSCC